MAPAGVLFKCQKSGGGEKLPEVMHKSLQFDVASIDEEQGHLRWICVRMGCNRP